VDQRQLGVRVELVDVVEAVAVDDEHPTTVDDRHRVRRSQGEVGKDRTRGDLDQPDRAGREVGAGHDEVGGIDHGRTTGCAEFR
jgi:hypothetical protein